MIAALIFYLFYQNQNGDHALMFDEISILKKRNSQNVSLRGFDSLIDHREENMNQYMF